MTPVQPEDVSAAVAFLASDEARSTTGVALPVDAGMPARCAPRRVAARRAGYRRPP